MRRTLSIITLALCIVTCLPEPVTTANDGKQDSQSGTTGISDKIGLASDLLRASPSDRTKLIDRLKPLGRRALRETFLWNLIEPRKGKFRWKVIDDLVDATREAGLEIHAVLMAAPAWAGGRSERLGAFPPDDPADYGAFVKAVATRYRGRIRSYELWNEPNMPRFWGGKKARPAEYAALMKAGYEAGKKADPGATFVMGGVTALVREPAFFRGVLDAGGLDACDAVGVHLYPDRFDAFEEQMEILVGRLDERKANHPIWVTEVGWPSRRIDLAAYAKALGRHGISRAQARRSVVLRRAVGLVYEFSEEELLRARDQAALERELADLGLTWKKLDTILEETVRDLAAEQAAMLRALSRYAGKEPRIGRVFWYRFEDRREGLAKEANFGLIDSAGKPKDSYRLMAGELDESIGNAPTHGDFSGVQDHE